MLACAVATLYWLVGTDAARRMIEGRIAAALSGEVQYETLSLQLLPWPGVEVRNPVIRVPGVIDGRAAVLRVRIALLPLLAANIRPAAVRLEKFVASLQVQPSAARDPFDAYRAAVAPVVEALTRRAAGMTVALIDSRLDVVYAGQPLITLSALAADAQVSGDAITLEASSAADHWSKAQGRARIAAGSLAASASMKVAGLRMAEQSVGAVEGTALRMRPGVIDATASVETDARSTARVTVAAATPQFVLAFGAREHDLGVLRAKGEIVRDETKVAVSLSGLDVGKLTKGASAFWRATMDGAAPSTFEFKTALFDFAPFHAAVMALAMHPDAAHRPLALVAAGTLHDFSVSGIWRPITDRITDRTWVQNIRAQARLDAASVAIPPAGIVVRNGGGRFVLADGVLEGSELAGDIGRSAFSGGRLALEFGGSVRLRSLSAALNADLDDAHAVARRLLERRPSAVVAGIEKISGRATGVIDYDARRNASPLTIEVASMRAQARHRAVPMPLAVERAALHYSGTKARLRGLSGSVGRSRVENAGIDAVLGSEPVIQAASGEAAVVFDEIFPWLRSIAALRPALGELESVTGTAQVRLARLHAPVGRPEALEFDATIEPRNVRIQAPLLPAPLLLAAGKGALVARTLKLDQVSLAAGDTQLTVSGTVNDYATAGRRADLELTLGTVGQQGLDWMRTRFQLPDAWMPHAPVEIASARVQWPGLDDMPRVVQARGRLGSAVEFDIDASWRTSELDLKRFALKDADTDVNVALHWKPGAVDFSFDGKLDSRTFSRLLTHPPADVGAVRGNFRAALDTHDLQRSTATGAAEGGGINLEQRFGIPLAIERFRLEAAERMLRVHESAFVAAGQRMEASGSVESRQETLAIDGRLTAKTLDAARILEMFAPADTADSGRRTRGEEWNLPIEGRLALSVGSVIHGQYELRQVDGALSIARNRIVAEVKDSRLCDIALPFTAVLVPGRVELKTQFKARGENLAQSLQCLAGGRVAATGTYDLDAEISAGGRSGALLNSAQGSFRFAARDGRIQRAEALSRTLAVNEIAERLKTAPEQVMKTGLDYETISIAGTLEAGRAQFDHVTLVSPTVGMTVSGEIGLIEGSVALQGLVAPFDAVNRAARNVPVVGWLAGGPLVVIPVSITGELYDPRVEVSPAAAIGATLFNLMANTFKAPLQLLDPFAAKAQRAP